MTGSASAAAPGPEGDAGQAQPAPRDGGTDEAAGGQRSAPPYGAPPPAAAPADSHADFLITSEERDAAEARLRQAVADEVLSLEEFGDRIRLLLAARTRGDLHAAVVGLPVTGEPAVRAAARGRARPVRTGGSAVAILGNAELRGRWRPDGSTSAVAVLGESTVDLQGVEFEGDELVISAVSALGTVEIIVPEGVEVDLRGIAILGERRDRTDGTVIPGAPVVRIDGLALLGDVVVRHPKPKERIHLPDGRGAFADRVPLRPVDRVADRDRRPGGVSSARRWLVRALVALALAVPVGWVLSADDVAGAVFGSASQVVSAVELEAGDVSVGAPVVFGSVDIQVPEGVNVERDGVVIFGSTSCEPACVAAAADAPTVQIRTLGAFGSVEITQVPGSGTN